MTEHLTRFHDEGRYLYEFLNEVGVRCPTCDMK